MNNNPFHSQPTASAHSYYNWQQLISKPQDYKDTPTTQRLLDTLCIAVEDYSMGNLALCMANNDNDIRRRLANIYHTELCQQIKLNTLIGNSNSILVHAVDILNLSIHITASIAQYENDSYIKKTLEYTLLELVDQLYRLCNLVSCDTDIDIEQLVDNSIDIIPTRPMICQHLHPHDTVKRYTNYKQCNMSSIIHINMMQAISGYMYRYLLNATPHYPNTMGRQLLTQLTLLASQHNTMYNSLADVNANSIEQLLITQYTECYCYYNCYNLAEDKLYSHHYDQELYHLHSSASILQHSNGKVWQQILGKGTYPNSFALDNNNQYIRQLIASNIHIISHKEDYVDVATLDDSCDSYQYQQQLNSNIRHVPSHNVVARHIADYGNDYRHTTTLHPIEQHNNRQKDNITIGRIL